MKNYSRTHRIKIDECFYEFMKGTKTMTPIEKANAAIKEIKTLIEDREDGPGYLFDGMPNYLEDIEAALEASQAVDVEALKRHITKIGPKRSAWTDEGWNECLDYLSQRGLLRTQDLLEKKGINDE